MTVQKTVEQYQDLCRNRINRLDGQALKDALFESWKASVTTCCWNERNTFNSLVKSAEEIQKGKGRD